MLMVSKGSDLIQDDDLSLVVDVDSVRPTQGTDVVSPVSDPTEDSLGRNQLIEHAWYGRVGYRLTKDGPSPTGW